MIHIFRNIRTIDFPSTEAIEYLQHDAECASYLDTLISDCVGEVLVNTDLDELVGYAFVYNKQHEYAGFIFNVFLYEQYRGYGLGQKLVTDVINKYDGVDLTVDKDNTHAIELYLKNDFVIVQNEISDNEGQYYMKLKSELSKDDKIVNFQPC